VPADRAEFYSEYVAQQLVAGGLKVVTPKEIASTLGMERQRQLLGCNDTSNCVAEIAAALGTDGVVQGEVAKLESGGFQVSLKIVWSRDGRPLVLFSGRAVDEPSLLDVMGKGAQLIARDLTTGDWVRLTVTPATHSIMPASASRVFVFVPAVIGLIAAGVGIFGMVRASSDAGQLKMGTFESDGEAQAVAHEGSALQTVGAVMFGVAGVGIATSLILYLLGSTQVLPQVSLGPSGGSIGLVGVWP
jgi:hypothetical protein